MYKYNICYLVPFPKGVHGMDILPYILNQRRIKMAHFNSSGSDISNDLKLAPLWGCGFTPLDILNADLWVGVHECT